MFQDSKKTANGNGHAGESESRTLSAKQVRWKMKTSGIELMTITPAVAEAMLESNTKNRPYKEKVAKRWAAQMIKGNWKLTPVPIIFSRSGRLLDGQHRLWAVVLSGVTIQAYVTFGVADEIFAYIDMGVGRTAGDIFAINGVTRANMMAAAARWVMLYDTDTVAAKSNGETSTAELYEFFTKHPRLMDSMEIGEAFARSRLAPPSPMAAMHYICTRKSRADADVFFTNIALSTGLKRNSPAWKLHQVMVKNSKEANRSISTLALCAYTIKAWNATRDGQESTHLRWRGEKAPDEAFPKAR